MEEKIVVVLWRAIAYRPGGISLLSHPSPPRPLPLTAGYESGELADVIWFGVKTALLLYLDRCGSLHWKNSRRE